MRTEHSPEAVQARVVATGGRRKRTGKRYRPAKMACAKRRYQRAKQLRKYS